MKKGISIWAFSGLDLNSCFNYASECGFDGIELSFDEEGSISPYSAPSYLHGIRRSAENAGLSLYSLASGIYWKYSLTSNDKENRSKASEYVKRQLDAASELGCDTILILPGMVQGFDPSESVVPYDTAYERSLNALGELSKYAESVNVTIGIENVWNKFLLSPVEMRDFIDKINSPYVKAYFDVGNVVRDGFPEQWINILGSRIAKVHFKDYIRNVGTLSGFTELLAGDVDYAAVMKALRNIGYDGWVTAELTPRPEHLTPMLKNISNTMNYIINSL